MNIHEFQAKALFAKFGVPCPRGVAAHHETEFENAVATVGLPCVVKSQIHAGGRGKGTFVDGFQGGVKLAKTREDAHAIARRMLGNTLVTKQTGPAGRKVQTIYFDEAIGIAKEYYLAILLDRGSSRPVVIASTEGGMDIEAVAAATPEKITKAFIDPAVGLQAFQARQIAFALGFSGGLFKQALVLLENLYRVYWELDASMVEINPLITTTDGRLAALDAKISFDDNSLFRHPEIVALRDLGEEDPKETAASEHDLNYIALDGNIACLVNGAGLAMATMDIVKHFGGAPANFLDVGGGASKEQVEAAFKIILTDPNVKGIFVNIFGGIMDCNVIAQGVVAAVRGSGLGIPLVVRLEGNNVEAGNRTLAESGLAITSAGSMADGARKIVQLVA
jgi:succinyl-CoA synthetase beta subunit